MQVTNSRKFGKTCRLDYWWPNVLGLPATINHSESYLKPFKTVWREGKDVYVKRQSVDSIFYVFQPPFEDVLDGKVRIPREARDHFITQGTLDSWPFLLDLEVE